MLVFLFSNFTICILRYKKICNKWISNQSDNYNYNICIIIKKNNTKMYSKSFNFYPKNISHHHPKKGSRQLIVSSYVYIYTYIHFLLLWSIKIVDEKAWMMAKLLSWSKFNFNENFRWAKRLSFYREFVEGTQQVSIG